jgi:signal transduction histidine kinase
MGLPGELNPEQTKQLRIVQSSGKHLLSLINDLLDLARIESGNFELNPEVIDCSALLEEVATGLRPGATVKELKLEVHAPDDIELTNDRRALSQILINLTNNAIKFTDEGVVRLGVTRAAEGEHRVTRFAVTDTGRGIKTDDQQKLFAAFEQISNPTSQPYEGTGLGLYICQTMAPLIGGTIGFESEFGKGSTFTLELRSREVSPCRPESW